MSRRAHVEPSIRRSSTGPVFAAAASLAGLVAGTGCADDVACRASTFPTAPAGSFGIIHVSAACSRDGADGSVLHPYPSIQQGIDQAASGGVVLVAPGTYAENIEISKPLMVLGSGADAGADDAAVKVAAPEPNAVVVTAGAKDVLLRGLVVSSPISVGVRVEAGASATLDRSRVEDARPDANDDFGYGVLAVDDGSIIICLTRIERSALAGVLFSGAGGEVRDSVLRGNGTLGSAELRGGVRAEAASKEVWIHESTIEDSGTVGVGAFGSAVRLTNTVVAGTRGASVFGDGVIASGAAAKLTLESGNTIRQNARVGVLFSGGALGSVMGSEIRDNGAGSDFAAGIWAQAQAGAASELSITGNTIAGNRYLGVGLTSGARAVIDGDNTIRETVALPVFMGVKQVPIGDGLGIFAGAGAKVTHNAILANGRFGVILSGAAGTSLVDQNNIVGNTDFDVVVQSNDQQASVGQNEVGSMKVVTAAETPFVVVTADFATP